MPVNSTQAVQGQPPVVPSISPIPDPTDVPPAINAIEQGIVNNELKNNLSGKATAPTDNVELSSSTAIQSGKATEDTKTSDTSEPQKRSGWSRMWSKSARNENKEALHLEIEQKEKALKQSGKMTAGAAFNIGRDKTCVDTFGKYSSDHDKKYKATDYIVCKTPDGSIQTVKANAAMPEGYKPIFQTSERAMRHGSCGHLSQIPSNNQRESAFNFFSEKEIQKGKTSLPKNAKYIYNENGKAIGYFRSDFKGPDYNKIREDGLEYRSIN